MIAEDDLKPTIAILEGIVNSAVHPDVAVRAVFVDLKPIRKEIKRLKQVMAHCSESYWMTDDESVGFQSRNIIED